MNPSVCQSNCVNCRANTKPRETPYCTNVHMEQDTNRASRCQVQNSFFVKHNKPYKNYYSWYLFLNLSLQSSIPTIFNEVSFILARNSPISDFCKSCCPNSFLASNMGLPILLTITILGGLEYQYFYW